MLRLRPAALDLRIGPLGLRVLWPSGEHTSSERAVDVDGTGLAAALEDALGGIAPGTKLPRRARVTLDDAFCWIDVAEGDIAALSADQIALLAKGCASEVLGAALDQQQLRWQVQADGRHLMLMAAPEPLIEGTRMALAAHGMALEAMQCAFTVHWNAVRRRAELQTGVLAVVHEGHAVLVRVAKGVPTALSREYVAHSVVELERAARRLLTRHGDAFDAQTPRLLVSDDPWRTDKLLAWVHLTTQPAEVAA